MSGKYEYSVQNWYHGMSPRECRVWTAFIQKFPDRFDSVDYNVRVGSGSIAPEPFEQQYPGLWKLLTQKRIDAVGWNEDIPTIVEVKDEARSTALGELITYSTLYKETFSINFDVPLLLVCVLVDPDLVSLFAERNVEVVEVEADLRGLRV